MTHDDSMTQEVKMMAMDGRMAIIFLEIFALCDELCKSCGLYAPGADDLGSPASPNQKKAIRNAEKDRRPFFGNSERAVADLSWGF